MPLWVRVLILSIHHSDTNISVGTNVIHWIQQPLGYITRLHTNKIVYVV